MECVTSTTTIPHIFQLCCDLIFFSFPFFLTPVSRAFTKHNSELRRASITSRQLDMNIKVLQIRGRKLVGFHRGCKFISEQVHFKIRLRDMMQESHTQQRFYSSAASNEFFSFIGFFGYEALSLHEKDKYCAHKYMHTIQHTVY